MGVESDEVEFDRSLIGWSLMFGWMGIRGSSVHPSIGVEAFRAIRRTSDNGAVTLVGSTDFVGG
jgi:hypothetical protein